MKTIPESTDGGSGRVAGFSLRPPDRITMTVLLGSDHLQWVNGSCPHGCFMYTDGHDQAYLLLPDRVRGMGYGNEALQIAGSRVLDGRLFYGVWTVNVPG